MCGIVGLLDPTDASAPGVVDAMCDRIHHRGPDEGGSVRQGPAQLGMRRLSIIDIEGGSQPLRSISGRSTIVFNGEIYNHEALRSELRSRGSAFRTRSDTEVIVEGFERWGLEVFDRLDGMFAVAIWDAERGHLLLARDRIGEKPLYLWRRGAQLAFASEPKCFEVLGRRPRVDRDAVDLGLQLGYLPETCSVWADVSKVPPGAHMRVDSDLKVDEQRYWTLPRPLGRRPKEPVEELRKLIDESVRSRLVADVEVGLLLSGGIDSSLIAASASDQHRGIKTFSVSMGTPDRDEAPVASQIAQRLGTSHHELRVEAEDMLARVGDLAQIYDEPFADASALPTLLVSEFARQHVKVALAGDGGDEVLSGYPRYADEPWRRRLGRLPTPALRLASRLRRSDVRIMSRIGNAAALADTQPSSRYYKRAALLTPAAFESMTGRPAPLSLAPLHGLDNQFDLGYAAGARRSDLLVYLPGDLLTKVDRASMAASLEVRAPFLSRALVEWAALLDEDALGPPGEKRLGRELSREIYGDLLADLPKRGFSVPLAAWLRGDLAPLLDGLEAVYDHGFVRREGIDQLRRRLHEDRPGTAGPLWATVCLEQWLSRWQ